MFYIAFATESNAIGWTCILIGYFSLFLFLYSLRVMMERLETKQLTVAHSNSWRQHLQVNLLRYPFNPIMSNSGKWFSDQ